MPHTSTISKDVIQLFRHISGRLNDAAVKQRGADGLQLLLLDVALNGLKEEEKVNINWQLKE